MSSELQQQIPEDPVDGINYRFFQVITHALLFHFHANFIIFHGQIRILGHYKVCAMTHAKIEGFSAYRAGYTRKTPSQLHTYAVVWKTVAYAAAHEVF